MNRRPVCVVVAGRPGSGKTTLAKKLGGLLCLPVLSRDEIKEGYVHTEGIEHARLPPETNGVVSRLFFEIVRLYLAGRASVVIEAAFQHKVWEAQMPMIAELASPIIVICAADADLAASRHLRRGLENPAREFCHGDSRVAHYRQTGEVLPAEEYVAPEFDLPTIHVSTEDGYSPGLEQIATQIRQQSGG